MEKIPTTEEDKLINLSENSNDFNSNQLQSDNSSSLFQFLNKNKSLLKKLEISNNNISTDNSFNKSNLALINSENKENSTDFSFHHLNIVNKINNKITNKLTRIYSDNEYQPINYEIMNRCVFKKEKISETDSEDDGSDNEDLFGNYVLLPDNLFKIIMDYIISIIIMYFSIYSPYDIAFGDNKTIDVLEIIADIFLILDIFLSFFTAYYNSAGILIAKKRYIVRNYLQGYFLIDCISVFPLIYFFYKTNNETFNNLLLYFKLIRILKMKKRINNIKEITQFIFQKIHLNKKYAHLVLLIILFLLCNHFCACLWFFLSKIKKFSAETWLTNLGYNDKTNFEKYVISFYWSLTTITTVGYGDITALNTLEKIFTLFIMSFGIIIYSFGIGSLSSILYDYDLKSEEMNQKLNILLKIKKNYKINQSLYEKIKKILKLDSIRNNNEKMNFILELPRKIKIELLQIMQDTNIKQLNFFKNQSDEFFAYVSPMLKPLKFFQNDYLYKMNDIIDEIVFISKGTVTLYIIFNNSEKEFKDIKKKMNFGEIEMCLNETLSFSIKVKSRICEIFILKKSDFLKTSINFKETIENFLQISLLKYLRLSNEKIIKIKEYKKIYNFVKNRNKQNKIKAQEKNNNKKDENSNLNKNNIKLIKSNTIKSFGKVNKLSLDNKNNISSKTISNVKKKSIKKSISLNNSNMNRLNKIKFLNELSYNKSLSNKSIIKSSTIKNNDKSFEISQEKIFENEQIDKIIYYLHTNNLHLKENNNDTISLLNKFKGENNITKKNKLLDKIGKKLKTLLNK